MWLKRQLEWRQNAGQIVVYRAPRQFGALRVAQAFAQQYTPTAWFELKHQRAPSDVELGGLVACAINQSIGAHLLNEGAGTARSFGAVQHYIDLLGPFRFVVIADQGLAEIADRLVTLVRSNSACDLTIVSFDSITAVPDDIDGECGASVLRVLEPELKGLLDNSMELSSLRSIAVAQDWSIDWIEQAIAESEGLPFPTIYGTQKDVAVQVHNKAMADLLDVLIAHRRWIPAFGLSLNHFPEHLPRVIDSVGKEFFDTGQYDRLWEGISSVDKQYLEDDRVMYWYYASALTQGRHVEAASTVRDYLTLNEAPRLRGLFAVSLPASNSLGEATRACLQRRDSYTLKFLAFSVLTNGGGLRAVDMLREAFYLAQEESDDTQVVDIANKIGEALLRFGQFRHASEWSLWALEQCYARGVGEVIRILEIEGSVVFSGIVSGRFDGLQRHVDKLMAVDQTLQIPSLISMLSTIGDYHLVLGDVDTAIDYYSRNAHGRMGPIVDAYAYRDLVRAYVAAGDYDKATQLAIRVYSAIGSATAFERALGELTIGTALAHNHADRAEPRLRAAIDEIRNSSQATLAAQASLQLARCLIVRERIDEAEEVLSESQWCLGELGWSGWRLFGGTDEYIRDVWTLFRGEIAPIEFYFLGSRKALINRSTEVLPLRWCEVLTLLSLKPLGLTGSELAFQLYGDSGTHDSVKSTISRLRQVVPIESRPYRLSTSFNADYLDVENAIVSGNYREALDAYKGPLLGASRAPGVVEYREHLEEALREAVLVSGEVRALLQLGRRLGKDLEIWERAAQLMSPSDPQYPFVHAQINRIRRDWWDEGTTVD